MHTLTATGCASTRPAQQTPDERYKLVSDALEKLDAQGRVGRVRWSEDGTSVRFISSDVNYRYDLVERKLERLDPGQPEDGEAASRPATRPQPARGRQRDREISPDGKWVAVCKDWNVVLERVPEPQSRLVKQSR